MPATASTAIVTTMKTAGSPEAFRLVDYDYVVGFARFARKCGARTFVLLTSVDSTPKSRSFYLQVKGEAEQAVETVGFESLYIFRPSFLIGNRREVRTGERIGIRAAKALQFVLIGSLRKYRPITAETVASAMSKAAEQAEHGVHVWHYDEIVDASVRR